MDFKNRTALVTGGTGALGGAVALDLLEAGARVAVTYHSEAGWKALERSAGRDHERLEGLQVDLTQASDVERAVGNLHQRSGRIDFLVTAAGGFATGKSYETDERAWDHMLDLNLRTVLNIVRPVVPQMMQQNFGRVVTVSSGAILNSSGAGIAAYAVSKGAVRRLSEILAEEVKGYDIRVHCVMPGTMDTEANRRAMPKADFSKWVKTKEVARVIHELLAEPAAAPGSVVVPVLGWASVLQISRQSTETH